MKPAIIMEMACTKYVCGDLLAEIWPDPATRPYLISESASGFSAAHKQHFEAIAAANGGRIIQPVLAKNGVDPAGVSEVALVGFSAGCWGVAEMLQDPDASSVTAVMCVDGLHYPTGSKFEAFARRAAASEALLVDLYSAIPVTGYTSTRDSAHKLAGIVGAGSVAPMLEGSDESFSRGGFHAIGFPGTDAPAHVSQVQTYQPLAWKAFLGPWLGGDRRSGFTSPVQPGQPVGPNAGTPGLAGATVFIAMAIGMGAFIAADMTWNLTDRLIGQLGGP